MIDKYNTKENSTRIDWDYKVGEKVLMYDNDIQRKLDAPQKGPYVITAVHVNGNLTINKGTFTDRVNIRRCKPYLE